eukprot:2570975-Pyramimonas_sp.AAC.1
MFGPFNLLHRNPLYLNVRLAGCASKNTCVKVPESRLVWQKAEYIYEFAGHMKMRTGGFSSLFAAMPFLNKLCHRLSLPPVTVAPVVIPRELLRCLHLLRWLFQVALQEVLREPARLWLCAHLN